MMASNLFTMPTGSTPGTGGGCSQGVCSIDHQAKQLKRRAQQQQQSSSSKTSKMEAVEETPNESTGEEKAEEAPPPPSRQPEKCCCQRPQCTEDVTESTFVCAQTSQKMSSKCCHLFTSYDGDEDDGDFITICERCYTEDSL